MRTHVIALVSVQRALAFTWAKAPAHRAMNKLHGLSVAVSRPQ
jgi:hypothetical protein